MRMRGLSIVPRTFTGLEQRPLYMEESSRDLFFAELQAPVSDQLSMRSIGVAQAEPEDVEPVAPKRGRETKFAALY